jgi:hypothetical protein
MRINSTLLIAIALSIGGFRAHAFEIQGRVVDLVTQDGLGTVQVSFLTLDGKPIDRTETDGHGGFRKDIPPAVKQFRMAYAKADGGPEGIGYEGYGRSSIVENNVKVKDVDTVALRARRKAASAVPGNEKEAITKDWLSYYLVTKDTEGLKNAIKFYAVDETGFKRSVRLMQGETGRSPEITYDELLFKR